MSKIQLIFSEVVKYIDKQHLFVKQYNHTILRHIDIYEILDFDNYIKLTFALAIHNYIMPKNVQYFLETHCPSET